MKSGTLKAGQHIVCDTCTSTTRIMEDFGGETITEALPSDPVRITGFDKLPPVGSIIRSFETKKEAEEVARENSLNKAKSETVIEIGPEDATVAIPVIIKASTTDVIEAIIHEIRKIKNDRVKVVIVSAGVGLVSENDVKIAMTKVGSVILGFDTKIDSSAKSLAERAGIPITIFNIIYKLSEHLEKLMLDKRPKMKEEQVSGRAKILRCFSKTKDKQIVGGRVEEGTIEVGEEVRIMRRDVEIGHGRIRHIEQSKVEVKEVREGLEFGSMIESKIEIIAGDKIEAFKIVES